MRRSEKRPPGYSTAPGFVNSKGQIVVRATGRRSDTHPHAFVYVMRCERCGKEYEANGCDTHIRRCPGTAMGVRLDCEPLKAR